MVAAGSGSRLGASVPKALVLLDGVALVRRCVDNLAEAGVERVVVTIPAGFEDDFAGALQGADTQVTCVVGGGRRQDSVRLGLRALGHLPGTTLVLVHDAARPLVPAVVVGRVLQALRDGAVAVVPTLPVVDSIRRSAAGTSSVVDRSRLRAVQTPQGFRLDELVRGHTHIELAGLEVTDDAAACEALGLPVVLVEGHRHALKITEPVDMLLAAAILAAEGTP
ncbi:2-C-methyl-D-erythritol 4-phosphate cytidylyltransferase [Tessaracoccus antarcticus]|uniref:2-C-methyl-D-erythritol 4-phosphate cytidylyltransferase n=1 Tax=Tessaracoccus antarcticus TaxID=2479848 RepID=UPI0022788335|nr:2-C-methyl-D-erythritol 4-phosphate cytidylyltransferase [Tessaracoccus antarcticus]